tara:strand:- start:5048 stop:5293 length:246 start_codon:yes stop_codon:yes gene_type:complete
MKIEYIKWLDARGVSTGWEFKEDATMNLSEIISVGHVIEETDTKVVVCPNMDNTEEPQVCGIMAIPKVNIIERYELTKSVV